MSSWTRETARKPPSQAIPFVALAVSSPAPTVGIPEVRQWPNPLTRTQTPVGEPRPADTIVTPGEVRGFPEPVTRRSQAEARRQAQQTPAVQPRLANTIETPGEVRGFPEPVTRRSQAEARRQAQEQNQSPQSQSQQTLQRQRPAAAAAAAAAAGTPAVAVAVASIRKPDALKITQVPAADEPQVTVIIPLVGGIDFLEDAILSVKRQTYPHWTGLLGLVNLTDSQKLAVETTVNNAGLNNRFTVQSFTYDSKNTPAVITELAASIATTPLVAHLDKSDIWLPKKLELQVALLEKENADIVGSLYREFGESSKAINLPVGILYKGDFEKSNPLMLSAVLMKRDLAIFTDEFAAFDYDCWVRSFLKGAALYNLDAIQVLRRITRSTLFNTVDTHPELIRQKYLEDDAA